MIEGTHPRPRLSSEAPNQPHITGIMYDVVPANTDQAPATHPDNIQRGLRQRWVLFSMRPRFERAGAGTRHSRWLAAGLAMSATRDAQPSVVNQPGRADHPTGTTTRTGTHRAIKQPNDGTPDNVEGRWSTMHNDPREVRVRRLDVRDFTLFNFWSLWVLFGSCKHLSWQGLLPAISPTFVRVPHSALHVVALNDAGVAERRGEVSWTLQFDFP